MALEFIVDFYNLSLTLEFILANFACTSRRFAVKDLLVNGRERPGTPLTTLHLSDVAAGLEFVTQMGGDLLSVKATVFDEDFAGAGACHDYACYVNSGDVALEGFRIAHRAVL